MPKSQRLVADHVLCADEDFTVHSPGAVDIEGDRIVWVGPLQDATAPPSESSQPSSSALPAPPSQIHNLGGLLMPGLINTHCHTPMTLMRGAGDGLALKEWLTDAMWPREAKMTLEDTWWGMQLGSAEMLLAGITTSCEMYLDEEVVIEAALASGARLVMTPGIVLELREYVSLSQRLDQIIKIHAQHHDTNGRITVGIAPHSAYVIGVDGCAEIGEFAKEHDILLHTHIAETKSESAELEARFGKSVPQALAEAGVFEARTLAAHSIWLDDADLKTYAEHQVAVAHCPASNMKLGSGVARIADMLEMGITVALGTDGPASNDNLDLWEEVKLAPMLARVSSLNATDINSEAALRMVTSNAAAAVGLSDAGSLQAGKFADIIHIDLDDPAFVPICDTQDLLAHLVWAGSCRKVTDVWVAGERVVADGVCQTVDVEKACAEVNHRGKRLADEAG